MANITEFLQDNKAYAAALAEQQKLDAAAGNPAAPIHASPSEEEVDRFILDPGKFQRDHPRIASMVQDGTTGAAAGFVTGGPPGALAGAGFGAATGFLFPSNTGAERGASAGTDLGEMAWSLLGGKGRVGRILFQGLGAGSGAVLGSEGNLKEGAEIGAATILTGGIMSGLSKPAEMFFGSRKKSALAQMSDEPTTDMMRKLGFQKTMVENSPLVSFSKAAQAVFGDARTSDATAVAHNLGLDAVGARALFADGRFTKNLSGDFELPVDPKEVLKMRQGVDQDAIVRDLKAFGLSQGSNFAQRQQEFKQLWSSYVNGDFNMDSGGNLKKSASEFFARLSANRHLYTPESWEKIRTTVMTKELIGPALKTVEGSKLLGNDKAGSVIDPLKLSQRIGKMINDPDGLRMLHALAPEKGAKDATQFWRDMETAFREMPDFEKAVKGSGMHYLAQKMFFQIPHMTKTGAAVGTGAAAVAAQAGELGMTAATGIGALVGVGTLLNVALDSPGGARLLLDMVEGKNPNASRNLMKALVRNDKLRGTLRFDELGMPMLDIHMPENRKDLEGAVQKRHMEQRTTGGAF